MKTCEVMHSLFKLFSWMVDANSCITHFFRYTYNKVSFLVHVPDLILVFCIFTSVLPCMVSLNVLVLGLILVFYVHKLFTIYNFTSIWD